MRGLLYTHTGTATGNGTTDDTAALQAVMNADKFVSLDPTKTYQVQTLSMPTNGQFFGNGTKITTISNAPVLKAQGTPGSNITGVRISGLNIHGEGRPGAYNAGKNDQVGVLLEHASNCHISHSNFESLQGAGVRAIQTVDNFDSNLITGCTFKSNNIGFDADNRGEYIVITGGTMVSNNLAARINAGNIILSGVGITGGTDGIYVGSGANGAHGIVSGCHINHVSGIAIYTEHTLGHTFEGCHVYVGKIHIKNSYGMRFNGGQYSLDELILDVADGCRFSNLAWIGSPVITKLNFNAGNTTATKFINVTTLAGIDVTTP